MPFDYIHVQIPRQFAAAPDKARQMYRQELRERAGMLRRLGHSQEEALLRLRANFRWDWESASAPAFVAELEQQLETIVGEAYPH